MILPSLRVLTVCGVLIVSPALFTASTSVRATSPCEALARWAAQYQGASPSLDDLARFDRAHRRAIVAAVSPSVRAALWREHLRRFSHRADLSEAQRALIRDAMALTTPALYEGQPAAVEAFETLWPRIDAAFAGEQKRAWFDLRRNTRDVPATTWDRLAQAFTVGAQYPFCECNQFWDDCWSGFCVDTIGCNAWGPGCGPMNAYGCNGMCS